MHGAIMKIRHNYFNAIISRVNAPSDLIFCHLQPYSSTILSVGEKSNTGKSGSHRYTWAHSQRNIKIMRIKF